MGRRSLLSCSGGLNRYIGYLAIATLAIVISGCTDSRSVGDDHTSADDTPSPTATTPPSATPIPTEASVVTSDFDEVVSETDDEGMQTEPTPKPTESPATEVDMGVNWVTHDNQEHGYTLEHPEGWIVGPPMYGSQHLVNDDRACAACADGTPSGTVLMHITPGVSPSASTGEPFTVGDGIDGKIYYSGIAGDQDPDQMFYLHYHTADTDWLIYAYFGDPIDDDNELFVEVIRIIESIRHHHPPTVLTPVPAPEYELVRTWTGFDRPTGIGIDSTGNVYIADSGNDRVVKISQEGVLLLEITQSSRGERLNYPMWVGVGDSDGTGLLHVTELGKRWVSQYFIVDDHQAVVLPGWGWDQRTINFPYGVTVSPYGINAVYVAVSDSIMVFSPTGHPIAEVLVGGLLSGIALDSFGSVFVTDQTGGRLVKVGANGQVLGVWHGFSRPDDIAIDHTGYIYLVESGTNRVVRLNSQGAMIDEVGSPGMFDNPRGVAVDADGMVYVSDNTSVRIFRPPTVR